MLLILICHWGIDVWEDKQHDRLQDTLPTHPSPSPSPTLALALALALTLALP